MFDSTPRKSRPVCCGLLSAAMLMFVPLAHAQEAVTTKAMSEPLAAGNLAQLTLGLLVVLGAVLATAWLLRRYGGLQTSGNGALRILGGLSMGPRERVVLVQVGDTQLLLGVAPGRVQTLHKLDQPVDIAESNLAQGKFADRLQAMMKKS